MVMFLVGMRYCYCNMCFHCTKCIKFRHHGEKNFMHFLICYWCTLKFVRWVFSYQSASVPTICRLHIELHQIYQKSFTIQKLVYDILQSDTGFISQASPQFVYVKMKTSYKLNVTKPKVHVFTNSGVFALNWNNHISFQAPCISV